ncbi:MAG TPA: alpha-2-macroglobulin family protein, partial [Gemmataceae bacterium]|nr:alpha-2-macroglobulin family protein [Gemmataceae bacterium]
PEGGDLVAGVANRVYFRASTRTGKPADLKGRLVDDAGKVVVPEVATLTDADQPGANQGLGAFTFTPQAGRKYELKIDQPAGIESKHLLPDVKDDGVVLSVREGLVGNRDPIRVVVRSGKADRKLFVGAYCRGRLLDHKPAEVKKGESAEIALWPAKGVGGVYRVTVFEDRAAAGASRRLVPVAERLVYRQPAEQLLLNVRPDKKVYVPGDRAKLSLSARTEQEHPAGAVLWVAVVDKSVVALADEKTARSMPTHFYLTTEVRKPDDLEHADFLVGNHPKAAAALDLLLGTQGWRRFAEQDPNKFRDRHKDEAERLLVMTGQSPRPVDFEEREKERVLDEFDRRFLRAKQETAAADQQVEESRHDAAYLAALARLDRYDRFLRQARSAAMPVLGLALGLFVLAALAVALVRRSAAWHVAWAACALLLAVGVGVRVEWGGRQSTVAMSKMEAERRAAPARDAAEVAEHWKAERDNLMAAPEAMPEAPPADAKDDREAKKAAEARDAGKPGDFAGAAIPGKGAIPAPVPPRAPARMDLDKARGGAKGDELRRKQFAEGHALRLADGKANFGAGQEARDFYFRRGAGAMPAGGDGRRLEEQLGLRQLAQDRVPQAGLPGGGRRGLNANVPPPPFVVREYAHAHPKGGGADLRHDFTETVFWQPALVTADGKAEVAFDLSDSVTTYQVAVMGHTLDGRLGAAVATFDARLPLTIEPKVPFEVTATDKIDVPLSVANNTLEKRAVTLRVPADALKGLTLLRGQAEERLTVEGDRRTRRVYRFQPNVVEGQAALTFEGRSEPFAADIIRRKFAVVPDGFPVAGSRSDLLEGSASYDVVLPESWVKGTLQCQATVYPSTLADLQKGLEAMLREPNGCFEQTSTSNYPNLLILDYLKESDQARPEVEKRARDLLARGYQKLTSFECPWSAQSGRHGFEWFGSRDQGHEALTAYGLLQFRDLSRVQDVDPALLKRTRDWLMSQRDGKGGFKRNARALDTFGRAPEHITNAYIVWAVTESGKDDDVAPELNALFGQAKASKDPYFLALVANSLINRGRAADAVPLLKKVAAAQKDDGHLDAEKTSITGSGGRDLQIETTALAVMAWLKANNPAEFNPAVQKAVRWIGRQRGGYGGFGSTQSTILALKALIAYTKANKKTPEAGTLKLYVGDRLVTKLDFAAGAKDALELKLPDAEKHLQAGKNRVRVEITGKNAFPCTLAWSYRTLKPVSADDCPVRLATRLEKPAAKEGQSVTLHVTVENPSKAERSMVVAIVGLPAGLSVPEDMKQLKRHAEPRDDGKKPGLISYFELRNRELILYWRGMAPGQKVEVPVELVCRVPGEYRGPASRAYLYYNADHKHWVEPLSIAIRPREE